MNVLKSAQIILSILPIVSSVVKEVEAAAATPGNGTQKLQLALTLIKTIYDQTNPEIPFSGVVSQITSIIAALVTFYNSISAFVTTAKAA
jgi:hypothetical protein